ncbi:MAG: phenylalanine--tRNA ligase beta subunit-related protein [Candidatus Micrarchaeota archaeon]
MKTFTINVEESTREKLAGLGIGCIHFIGVRTEQNNSIVDQAIKEASRSVSNRFKDTKSISDDPVIKGIRAIFSKAGLDPTKERASGEALIRRIVGGQGLYRINTVVDTNNVISLRTAYPCGVYDMAKLEGETITLTIGQPGQTYEGISGKPINVENRIITSDAKGAFGGPTADSRRTCITLGTKEVLMLIYHPASVSADILKGAMKDAAMKMKEATGATTCYEVIFSV